MRASVLALIGLFLVGCGNSLENVVVGTWRLQVDRSVRTEPLSGRARFGTVFFESETLELKSDRTFVTPATAGKLPGTWKFDGDVITFRYPDGEQFTGRVGDGGGKIELVNAGSSLERPTAEIILVKE